MARGVKKAKAATLTPEEKLAQALVPVEEQPYPVPENWCWVFLGCISEIIMGQSPEGSATTDDSSYMPLIGGAADMGEIYPKASRYTKAPTKTSMIDDIIVCIRATLGRPVFSDRIYCLGRGVASLRHYVGYKELYRYGLINFEQYLYDNATGTTFAQVSSNALQKMPFPLIPFVEQQRIVDRIESLFAKLDEAKEKAQAVVDGFEDRKAAILHKAFTGELTQSWRKANKVDYSSWKTKTLSETSIQIIDGDRGKNYPKKDEFFPEGYCIFLSAKNVTKRGFVFDECECITKEKDELLHNGRLERGDMVMTTRGTIGNVAIYDDTVPFDHLRINSGMVIYRGGSEFVKQYLIWLYQSKMITNQIDALRTGTAQPQLPIKVMNALQLPIPPLAEQTEIVRTLDRMIEKEVNAKEAAEQTLAQIDIMKKAILARAFRGELGTNDPADESAEELLKRLL